MSRMSISVTNDMPTNEIIAAIEATSQVRVVSYTVGVLERVFIVEPIEKPDPYSDLLFTHDFSFNGIGAYQHKHYARYRRRIGR